MAKGIVPRKASWMPSKNVTQNCNKLYKASHELHQQILLPFILLPFRMFENLWFGHGFTGETFHMTSCLHHHNRRLRTLHQNFSFDIRITVALVNRNGAYK